MCKDYEFFMGNNIKVVYVNGKKELEFYFVVVNVVVLVMVLYEY